MKLIEVAHSAADIPHGQLSQLQKLRGLGHAVADQKLLGTLSQGIPENLSEVASVQIAESCNIFHGNIILKILLNKGDSLLYIKIPYLPGLYQTLGGGAGQVYPYFPGKGGTPGGPDK